MFTSCASGANAGFIDGGHGHRGGKEGKKGLSAHGDGWF